MTRVTAVRLPADYDVQLTMPATTAKKLYDALLSIAWNGNDFAHYDAVYTALKGVLV